MNIRKKILLWCICLVLVCTAVLAHYRFDPWGYYWKVPAQEAALREDLIRTAESYLGCRESNGTHCQIIDVYNEHDPLAVGYQVTYTDSWCATFVSTAAIRCQLTQIIPTECGCQRQIALFQALGRWEEADNAIPLPGDLIYYDWDMEENGENNGHADHVGIVVGTKWPFVKVVEGNRDDMVTYRVIPLGHKWIRGYARPDYASIAK